MRWLRECPPELLPFILGCPAALLFMLVAGYFGLIGDRGQAPRQSCDQAQVRD